MNGLTEARQTVAIWVDMWANEIADRDEEDASDCDLAEKEVVDAVRLLLRVMPNEDDHVGWLRWNGRTYVTCDSDADGAFRVYRLRDHHR